MKRILVLKTSTSGADSLSNKLADAIVAKLTKEYPGASVNEKDLANEGLPHISSLTVAAYYTPQNLHDEVLSDAVEYSDKAIGELLESDIVVIGVPIHNFGIPSSLKSWVDHIARVGATFYFDETGMPKGMVHGKKVYLAIASGGIYSEGPMKSYDFTEPYLRAILGYPGITDITATRVEGSAIPGIKEVCLEKGLESVQSLSY